MSQARTPAREGPSKGHSITVGRLRAWFWVLSAGPFLTGACSSASSTSEDSYGGSPSGAGGRAPSGGYSTGAASRSAAGGTASSSRASSNSSYSGGGNAQGGGSYIVQSSAGGGATSAGGMSEKGGGAGGASFGSSGSGPAPSAGNAGGSRASTGAAGGATGMGGRTSGGATGTSAGGATSYPADAGAFDAGGVRDARPVSDAGSGGDCSFTGGLVTAALYPSGLTLRRACSPYFVDSITIRDNGALTVEPGVTVKFGNGGSLVVGMETPGRLVAAGGSSELITFTSQESEPSPGFWRGLVFGGGTSTGSKVAYARISAAGQSRDGAILGMAELPAQVLTIDHVTIDKVGDGASGILALGERSGVAITNSSFLDVPAGRYPISVYAASFSSIGTGNTFPSGTAIEVMGGTIDTNVSWSNPGLPVAITSDLHIQGTGSPVLSVGSGMNLKFGSNVAIQVGRSAPGKLTIAGTSLMRVTLTSLASPPVSGSWAGLQIWDYGKASISYADLRYGGTNNGDSRGNVTVESGAATVQLAVDHSSFSDSLGWGIYVPCVPSVQGAAIITVDTNTTYVNNVLGTNGPGLTCGN